MGLPTQKARNFKRAVLKLIQYIGRYRWAAFFAFLLAIASTIFMVAGPLILGRATDELLSGFMAMMSGEGGGINFGKIAEILLMILGMYVVSAACAFVQSYMMTGVATKVTYRIRKEADDKIHSLPLSYFDKVTHGEVLSLITNDIDTIGQSLSQSITQIITSLTTIVGIAVMMLTISWQLTLAALLVVPVVLGCTGLIFRASQKYFFSQQEYLGHVNGHVEEMYSAHAVVKAFNGEAASVEQFNKINDRLYHSAWKAGFFSGIVWPLTAVINNIGYVAVCVLGGWFAASSLMTVGGVQAFLQYVKQFNQPLMQVANISNILQQLAAASERVFEFIEEQDETPDKVAAISLKDASEREYGSVEFRHVRFGYTPEKVVIKDFNAKIQAGQRIAIVGHTGAGKTTVIKLLMRFYDVTGGAIMIGGVDIRDFRRDDLHSLLGMVLQDTWLYNGTIAENIRYGRLSSSDDEVRAAAKAAQVDHFVHALPGDYSMVLNEEANNVSQGQRQLITIARAILSDPQILILDEATSSVDTRTEVLIQKAMSNLMEGRTSFIIAHRLSTIRDADLILVMEEGDIVEQGKHAELLAKSGAYAKLYNSQFDVEE
jgi:ATP-binding cassette subfamily B protein